MPFVCICKHTATRIRIWRGCPAGGRFPPGECFLVLGFALLPVSSLQSRQRPQPNPRTLDEYTPHQYWSANFIHSPNIGTFLTFVTLIIKRLMNVMPLCPVTIPTSTCPLSIVPSDCCVRRCHSFEHPCGKYLAESRWQDKELHKGAARLGSLPQSVARLVARARVSFPTVT